MQTSKDLPEPAAFVVFGDYSKRSPNRFSTCPAHTCSGNPGSDSTSFFFIFGILEARVGTEKVENAENLDAIASLDDEGRVKWRRDGDSRKPWWTVLTTEERDEVSYPRPRSRISGHG